MNHVEITEYGRSPHRLTDRQDRGLAQSDVVTATPAPHQPGLWNVASRGKVGVAQVGDVEVWIHPKLPIDRLLFLVGYAAHVGSWRDEDVGLDIAEGLVPAIAQALCRQIERALRAGLLQGYRTIEESATVLRGRLREADQLRRHHGRAIPMEVRHDDFTVDVPENQILLAAITRMAGVPRVDKESERRLTALRARLVGVTTPARGNSLPSWQPSRLNQRYHTALRLAEVIWQVTSPEHTPGALFANRFLFNLWKIFEDFVVGALSEELHARYGGVAIQRYQCHLDKKYRVRMEPDLVWQVQGRPVAVVDAKYKQDKPFEDLYQVLAYCTALRLSRGHLVYARGNADPIRHAVRHADIEIVCHALDLTLPPAKLLAQVADIADELVASSPPA
ncbi:MAG: McrC family protein [Actinomycetota bacterium]|nr:McrC family protein [Actinomycetota bacterium]